MGGGGVNYGQKKGEKGVMGGAIEIKTFPTTSPHRTL